MILSLSFFDQLLIEIVPVLIISVILFIRRGYKRMSAKGYPVTATMIKWNLRLLFIFYIGMIFLSESLYGTYFSYDYGMFNESAHERYHERDNENKGSRFFVNRDYLGSEGDLYIICYGNKNNIVASRLIADRHDATFRYWKSPQRLLMTVTDKKGNCISQTVFDTTGSECHDMRAYIMRNSFDFSAGLFLTLLLTIDVWLYRYCRKKYVKPKSDLKIHERRYLVIDLWRYSKRFFFYGPEG